MKNRSIWVALLAFFFALVPRISKATPPDIMAWLWLHPEIANAISFDFPDTLTALPGPLNTPSPWRQKTARTSAIAATNRTSAAQTTSAIPAGASCPAFLDTLSPGKRLIWCQWPESYRQRLKSHFDRYWDWLEQAWPLYES